MSAEAVLAYLRTVARASPARVAIETGIHRREAESILSRLRDAGDIRRTGPHYYMPPVTADAPTVRAILCVMADGQKHDADEIARTEGAAGRHRAPAVLGEVMMQMCRVQIITRVQGGYTLAEKGRRMLPSIMPQIEMRPYIPPKMPPRRPGSMAHLTLPSVYAEGARG
jgi:hypothetical protein